jgi:chaperonin GroES
LSTAFFSNAGLRSGHSNARRFGQPRNSPIQALVQAVDLTKVVPQADRVLVRLGELPDKSAGGVLLPKSVAKFENYLVGEVISVGKEAAPIEKGQKVLFSDINAYEVNLGTAEKLCFCRVGDLLAVVE